MSFAPVDEEVNSDDREYVLSRYKEGLDACQIFTELEISGYDTLNYSTIEEIINSYERYHRN